MVSNWALEVYAPVPAIRRLQVCCLDEMHGVEMGLGG